MGSAGQIGIVNLRLSHFNCKSFSVGAVFHDSAELGIKLLDLMRNTRHRASRGSLQEALFFSRYGVKGTESSKEDAVGKLRILDREGDGVTFRIRVENSVESVAPGEQWPLRGCKSVRSLLDAISGLGVLDIHCTATFYYNPSDGFRSRVSLPMPLLLADNDGITHVEAMQFSRRGDHGIEYSVLAISPDEDDGGFLHSVRVDTKAELNSRSIRDLRNRCCSISTGLLFQGG